jgi:hypothetical protein
MKSHAELLSEAFRLTGVVALLLGQAGTLAQTNIAMNGSFESPAIFDHWTMVGGGGVHWGDWRGADGTNWLEPNAAIYQDVNTVPGRSYVVKFASGNHNAVGVRWGTLPPVNIGLTSAVSTTAWLFTNAGPFAATNNLTRLQFEGISGRFKIDAVQVGWAEEPPSLLVPLASRSTFEQGSASFAIDASGGPPLRYQWSLDGQSLAGATNRLLLLTNVAKSDAGKYRVQITNDHGLISSLNADLVVSSLPPSPLIIRQPRSLTTFEGYAADFYVVAFGNAPLSYQWRFGGTNIPNATNASYAIDATYQTNAGEYTIVASNQFGSTLSLPATLTVSNGAQGWIYVDLKNRDFNVIDRPIFDVDGTTRLAGSNFWAQLYAGSDPNHLRPVGRRTNFRSGSLAGYFYAMVLQVPGIPAGELAYLQLRVWDSHFGKSFEEAEANGGRFGKSNISTLVAHSPDVPFPPELFPLLSFNLQAGVSPLATAKIERDKDSPGGSPAWILIGDPGYIYVVEQRTPPNDWTPLLIVTNETGSVRFSDPEGMNISAKFYRARILEP